MGTPSNIVAVDTTEAAVADTVTVDSAKIVKQAVKVPVLSPNPADITKPQGKNNQGKQPSGGKHQQSPKKKPFKATR